MPIVLAIEPDRRQAAHVSAVVRHRVGAELVLADTTEGALDAIGNRVPDLVLVPALLSPQDDAALAAALRVIAAAAHVRTLTIPVFANTSHSHNGGGLLSRFRRGRSESSSVGCDPAVFAEQINDYLREAAAERADRAAARAAAPIAAPAEPTAEAPADASPVVESSFVEPPVIESPRVPPPAIESRVVEPVLIEPSIIAAPAVDVSTIAPKVHESSPLASTVFESTIVEAPVFEAAPPPSVVADVPVEPVRLIAPVIPTRPKPVHVAAPPVTAFEASLATSGDEEVQMPAPAPRALEFAEAAAAEFGDRAFVDARDERGPLSAHESMPQDPLDEPREGETPIDLSGDIVDISPEHATTTTRTTSEPERFEDEPFGVHTLSLEESLDSPADAAALAAASEATRTDTTIDSFKEFLSTEQTAVDTQEPTPEMAARKSVDETAWLTLGLRYMRQWPVMDGAVVEPNPIVNEFAVAIGGASAPVAATQAELSKSVAPAPAAPGVNTPAASQGSRPEHLDWAELVASLRQDIERRRKHPAPPVPATVTPIAARPAEPKPHPHPRPRLHAVEGAAPRGARRSTPIQDEWGFFDPQQCGFAALLAKLDEFSEAADEPEVRKTS